MILIDELKNDDIQLRLNSIRKLQSIAKALGPDRTRAELIPYLQDSVLEDEDEVLVALCEELGKLTDFIGGPEHSTCLLPPLEVLAGAEEVVVREKAVESLCKIAQEITNSAFEDIFIHVLFRLSKADWFTSKTSACGLFTISYGRANAEFKKSLRKTFIQLCHDDTPMVRRAAASALGNFAKQIEKEAVKSEILPLFQTLSNDEQDSVRLLGVENCALIGSMLTQEENIHLILPVIKSCSLDKSWRVRFMVARLFKELCEAVGPEITKSELVQAFVKLLKDTEAEVRTEASLRITDVCGLLPKDTCIRTILPCINDLVGDGSQHVRAALAQVIMGLAPIFGKEDTNTHLVELFKKLLVDDFPDVRLNIISKLDLVSKVIGIESLSKSLLPSIVDLAEDHQWRVRLAIIDYIPLLATQLGVEFFDEKLSSLCMTWLGDPVYSIREAATSNLKKLTEVFGVDWAKNNIIPKVLSLHTHPNYLYRMTTLFSISVLSSVVGGDVISGSMLPLLSKMVTDKVPNIRFNVAKTLQTVIPLLDSTIVQQRVKPLLIKLQEDSDKDVKFYATQALQLCNLTS
ncbi:protein phosphatase 2A scaffold subunit [Tieghemostelium lacteum]|uniref:Protein phosphatase 2A scaffold subunit n=1 Tax=Tieghemostelium lacteum TaxID=361077 RepID=A0A151ZIJ5_TIELA|nr:protein phosphatase 2A scaffold subunit [Tieghemostelium lacteum]|eukprot:KYQ93812.1 protein phosphatase 2A scaffold subunit [Tieghemostelium lacteum]